MHDQYIQKRPQSNGRIGYDGRYAATLLEKHRGDLLKRVQGWYAREELGAWRLEVADVGPYEPLFQITMARQNQKSSLNEAGLGLSQVFPVVVLKNLALHRGARLDIIEEPESHLHPAAHAALADLHLEGLSQPGLQTLIETHSEVFLLRIRRRIAEGNIDPNKVIFYWINDDDPDDVVVEPIHVLANGEVDHWPENVFTEDYEEVLAIQSADQQRELE